MRAFAGGGSGILRFIKSVGSLPAALGSSEGESFIITDVCEMADDPAHAGLSLGARALLAVLGLVMLIVAACPQLAALAAGAGGDVLRASAQCGGNR